MYECSFSVFIFRKGTFNSSGQNFGDASKIPGVSKADLTALLVWLKIREIKKEKANIFVEKKLSS